MPNRNIEVGGRAPAGGGQSIVLGEIELVGGNHRESGRREGGLLELPVEVGPADFPVAEGVFERRRAFPSLRDLGKLEALSLVKDLPGG